MVALTTFRHYFYAFVPEGDDQSIDHYVRSMSMGLRWERATNLDAEMIERVAATLATSAQTAHVRSLEYRGADARDFGRSVARSLKARTRDATRTVLIRVCSDA